MPRALHLIRRQFIDNHMNQFNQHHHHHHQTPYNNNIQTLKFSIHYISREKEKHRFHAFFGYLQTFNDHYRSSFLLFYGFIFIINNMNVFYGIEHQNTQLSNLMPYTLFRALDCAPSSSIFLQFHITHTHTQINTHRKKTNC